MGDAVRTMVRAPKSTHPFALVLFVGIIYCGCFVLRYGGLWIENDTSMFGYATEQILHTGSLSGNVYTHGFGYQTWLATLCLTTGLPVSLANTVVAPFLGMLLFLLPCYLCYSTVLKNEKMASLATLLLFVVPELMFSVLRGNHEKLSIALFVIGIYLLFKGMEAADRGQYTLVAFWVLMYYVTVLANASVNDYFASTVVFANLPTLAIVYLLYRKKRREQSLQGFRTRFGASVLTSYLVVLLVMFYIYPPAGQDFLLAQTISQKVQDLFLTLQPSSNPYSVVTQAWAGTLVNHIMSSFRQLLLGLSFVSFMYNVWIIYVRKRRVPLHRYFLLSQYLTYGLIIAISIPVDFAGAGLGSNLEVRNYTYLALIAVPMLAVGLYELMHRWRVGLRVLQPLVGMVISLFTVIGLTKTTLDPIVSNDWIFYTQAESEALSIYLQHDFSGVMWTGPDNRLTNLASFLSYQYQNRQNVVSGFDIDTRPQINDFMWSPVIEANLIAQQLPAPNLLSDNRVFDDGQAQIYHTAPTTIFQQNN